MAKLASQIKTGDVFHDGSLITLISETECFVTVSLSNGYMMDGRSVETRWKKTSKIHTMEK